MMMCIEIGYLSEQNLDFWLEIKPFAFKFDGDDFFLRRRGAYVLFLTHGLLAFELDCSIKFICALHVRAVSDN